eukprot:COSAG02_NODE_20378_length_834_cov_1.156463_1_plen_251_part_00
MLCYEGSQWWILTGISILGLLLVSIGFPLGMALWMRSTMSAELWKVRHEGKGRAVAYRDFRRKFSYIAGEFKPSGYYAECVDLIRKLVLSGMVSLLAPGTVVQSFATALFSLIFMVVHAHIWPYPFPGANVLKLFADAQVFVVALVGLVLRKDSETLSQEGQYDREFYGNVMLVLLVATLVPALATLAYKSPVERALVSLQEIASALPEPSTAASASVPPTQPQSQPTVGGSSSTSNDPSGAGSFNATIT